MSKCSFKVGLVPGKIIESGSTLADIPYHAQAFAISAVCMQTFFGIPRYYLLVVSLLGSFGPVVGSFPWSPLQRKMCTLLV